MSTKSSRFRVPANLQPWFEARRRFRLSHATVQMARELGLNPKKLGKLADTRDAPWKVPLAEFIAECYYKAHKRREPEHVRSLEQVIEAAEAKKARRKERKALRNEAAIAEGPPVGEEPTLSRAAQHPSAEAATGQDATAAEPCQPTEVRVIS